MNLNDLLPALERITPAVALREVTDPSTMPTVEVEVVRRGMDEFVSLVCYGLDVGGRDPDHDEGLGREGNIVLEDHFCGEIRNVNGRIP
jgi:hypothetical protein